MKSLIILILCCAPFLFAETEPTYHLSSECAEFDGDTLLLSGNIELEHDLGKIIATSAKLKKFSLEKDFFFQNLILEEDVFLLLQNQGTVSCKQASLDGINQKLYFKDNVELHSIISSKQPPIHLFCNYAECNMQKGSTPNKKDLLSQSFHTFQCFDNVEFYYAQKYHLSSDRAIYTFPQTYTGINNSKKRGVVELFCKDNDFCHLSYDHSKILCTYGKLDLENMQLLLKKPHGDLYLNEDVPIYFSSDLLYKHHEKANLVLKGNVFIKHPTMGILTTEEAKFIESLSNKNKKLQKIKALGATNITITNALGEKSLQLSCPGLVEWDIENKYIYATQAQSENKIVLKKNDLIVNAQEAKMTYQNDANSFKPQKISLEKDVYLISHQLENSSFLGVADKLQYFPDTKEIILISHSPKKVLFWQEDNAMHLSASKIHIKENVFTKKYDVQGIGDVKFSFNFAEEKFFNEVFSYYRKEK